MKKLLIIILLISFTNIFVNAQEFTPLKVELGAIYGLPTDEAFTGGVGFYFNPSYYFTDNINLGLKAEWAIIGASDTEGLNVSISAIGSYLVTANYFFMKSKIRPYIGVGTGLYSLGTTSLSSVDGNGDINIEYGNKFGVAPTVGLNLSHFTINASYNLILDIDEALAKKDYLSIGIGVYFGGGKSGNGYIDFGIDDDDEY
ncbi:MAG: OmpW family outer membrane protein [Bacteroidota bacterium]